MLSFPENNQGRRKGHAFSFNQWGLCTSNYKNQKKHLRSGKAIVQFLQKKNGLT